MHQDEQALIKAAHTRYAMLPHLESACKSCRMCGLGWSRARGERDPHVFADYSLSDFYKFMIVGQNPGWDEVCKGLPFVGQAGKNFNKQVEKSFWNRSNFYITNCVKCFTPDNRQPNDDEIEKCSPYLKMEIEIIKPVLVVSLGACAFKSLCPNQVFGECIGGIVKSDKYGVKVFPTYHPSPRNLSSNERHNQFVKDIAKISKIMNHYLAPF